MRELYPKLAARTATALALALLVVAGCGQPASTVRAPDPTAIALADARSLGRDGPYGVLREPRAVRVRVDDRIDVDVLVPLEADGTRARRRPVAVFVHGGLVAPARYEWLAIHLASRGFVVLVPSHALDLAFFEQENAREALRVLRDRSHQPDDPLFETMDDAPAAILGHSLGGVVSSSLWDEHPAEFEELVLFASYPAGDVLRPRASGRAVSVVGSADARVSITQARDGVTAIATSGRPTTLAVVEGMNHMQIADDVTASEADAAGVPTIDEAHARASLRWLLDATLWRRSGGTSEPLEDPSTWPAGITPGAP